jgi:hypothetical protein
MGVLVECISVIVKCRSLEEKYPGGVDSYAADAPNRTFCTDGHLARVGFMTPTDVKAFVERLELRDLTFFDGVDCGDVTVLDQHSGPTTPVTWCEFGFHPEGFSVAWLIGTSPSPMAVPPNWTLEQSRRMQFVPEGEAPERLLPMLRKGDVEVVLDFATGKELYLGRAGPARGRDRGM